MGLAKRKVCIIGGGVGGLTLALSLQQRGIPCRAFEKYDHFQHHRTGFLIWSYAIKILQELDVSVHEFGAPLEFFEVFGRKAQPISRMPIGAVSREHGAESYEMNRRSLMQAMSEMVGDDLQAGKSCVAVDSSDSGAQVTFEDGSVYEADVVIGCDGAHSVVRKWVQPAAQLNVFNAGGWIGVMDQHPAALKPNCHMDFWEPSIKAGVADIGNGQARWYVGMNGRVPDKSSPIKTQILDAVPVLPDVLQQCLDATPESEMVEVVGADLPPLDPWFKGRVLMLGDAAHATSPYAGMGACSAIADADCLAKLFSETDDWSHVFQAFQDERKPAADAIVKDSRKSLNLSTGRSLLKNWIRDWGLEHIPEKQMHQVVEDMVTGQ